MTTLGIVVETTAKTISEARYLAVAQAVRRMGWHDGSPGRHGDFPGVVVLDIAASGKRRWRFVVAPRGAA